MDADQDPLLQQPDLWYVIAYAGATPRYILGHEPDLQSLLAPIRAALGSQWSIRGWQALARRLADPSQGDLRFFFALSGPLTQEDVQAWMSTHKGFLSHPNVRLICGPP